MPNALHLVLFGMPDAGKSSLLGALGQVAQTQRDALGVRLADTTHGIADLQHRLYDDRPRETTEEIVPYSVAFEPFDGQKTDPSQRTDAVLVDCDGRVANEILTQRQGLPDAPKPGSLAGEVVAADALLLVVDAGANPVQVDTDLSEFVRFLRLFEHERGQQSEVGGLPVYLVLSKCDMLARSEDTPAAWAERVEQKKTEVGRRFRDFLASDAKATTSSTAFGEIDLRMAATAVRRPALAGAAARPRDPWGVAELFRDALAAAGRFRARRSYSQRRLAWTVGAAGVFVAGLLGFASVMLLSRETVVQSALSAKVEGYRNREGQTASVRLREPLQSKMSELADLAQDADFTKLSAEQQHYLKDRLAELESYRDYKERIGAVRPPGDAKSEGELSAIERKLRDDLAPPDAYKAEWRQTEACVLRDKWLEDGKALRRAVGEADEWYRNLASRGNRLMTFADRSSENAPLAWGRWLEAVNALYRDAETPPFRSTEKVRDSRAVPGGRAVTYASVLSYPSVEQARGEWERVRPRLERTRDVAIALGLASGSGAGAVLKLPDKFAADQARETMARLKAESPKYAEWTLADLPDAVAPEFKQAAQESYRRAVDAGRAVVLRQIQHVAPDGKDGPAAWRAVADWASTSQELKDWRDLAMVYMRLINPAAIGAEAEDPVAALVAFLRRDRFDVDLKGIRLTLTEDVKGRSFRPQGKFIVSIQAEDRTLTRITFRPDGDGVRDARRRTTTYPFAVEGSGTATIKPGDVVWADATLRDAVGREWKLSWWANGSRSAAYQMERLLLPPRLFRAEDKADTGELVEGVSLSFVPERGWPHVPDLVPEKR